MFFFHPSVHCSQQPPAVLKQSKCWCINTKISRHKNNLLAQNADNPVDVITNYLPSLCKKSALCDKRYKVQHFLLLVMYTVRHVSVMRCLRYFATRIGVCKCSMSLFLVSQNHITRVKEEGKRFFTWRLNLYCPNIQCESKKNPP